ncbi:MAG: CheR family methyltransferase [Myxococcota bacterium]
MLIYFDIPTKRKLLERIAYHMVPDGVLFVGMSETLRNLGSQFHMEKPGMYRKRGS